MTEPACDASNGGSCTKHAQKLKKRGEFIIEEFEVEKSEDGNVWTGKIDMGEMISVTLPRKMWNEVVRALIWKNSALKKEIKFVAEAISMAELWKLWVEQMILDGAEHEIIRQTLPSEREKDEQCAPLQTED